MLFLPLPVCALRVGLIQALGCEMTVFDRFTTESWTIEFPNDWIDSKDDEGTLYLESPAGDKGLYVSLWHMSESELRGSRELIETFQETELRNFLPQGESWDLISHVSDGDAVAATGCWAGINVGRKYWICGKQFAAGKYVLRATFHDYDSSGPAASSDFFSAIAGSLALVAA